MSSFAAPGGSCPLQHRRPRREKLTVEESDRVLRVIR